MLERKLTGLADDPDFDGSVKSGEDCFAYFKGLCEQILEQPGGRVSLVCALRHWLKIHPGRTFLEAFPPPRGEYAFGIAVELGLIELLPELKEVMNTAKTRAGRQHHAPWFEKEIERLRVATRNG